MPPLLRATGRCRSPATTRAFLLVEGTVEGSHTKPDASSDPDGLGGKLKELETASAAMIDAAGTDLVALESAMSGTGGACKARHDNTEVPRTDQRCGDLFGCTASKHLRP